MDCFEKELISLGILFPTVSVDNIRNIHENAPPETRVSQTLEHLLNLEEEQNEYRLLTENRRYAQLLHVLFPVYSEHKILKKLKKYRSCSDRWKIIVLSLLKCSKTDCGSNSGTKRKLSDNIEDECTECKRVPIVLKDEEDDTLQKYECDFHTPPRILRTEQVEKNNRCFNKGFYSDLPMDCADVRIKLNLKDTEKLSVNISTSKLSGDVGNSAVHSAVNRPTSNVNMKLEQEFNEITQQQNQIQNVIPSIQCTVKEEDNLLCKYENELDTLLDTYVQHDTGNEVRNDSNVDQIPGPSGYYPENNGINSTNEVHSLLFRALHSECPEGQAKQNVIIDQIPGPSTYYPEIIGAINLPTIKTEPHDFLPTTVNSSPIKLGQEANKEVMNGIPGPSTYHPEIIGGMIPTIKTEPDGMLPTTLNSSPIKLGQEAKRAVMNGIPGPSTYYPKIEDVTPASKHNPDRLQHSMMIKEKKRKKLDEIPGPSTYDPYTKRNEPRHKSRQHFDLIEYLVRVTGKSEYRVTRFCVRNQIDVFKKPTATEMDEMFQKIIYVDDDVADEDDDDTLFLDARERNPFSDESMNLETLSPPAEVVEIKDNKSVIQRTKPVIVDLTGGKTKLNASENLKITSRVLEVFPDVDPEFVRKLYENIPMQASSEAVIIDTLIEKLLEEPNYPKRRKRSPSPVKQIDPEEQLALIKELLPDADPTFLQMKVAELDPTQLRNFVSDALETQNYPTMKDYLRNQQLSSQMRQYTTEFSVENYVKLVPDPVATFGDPARIVTLTHEDMFYLETYFRNKFNRLPVRIITPKLGYLQQRVYQTYKDLLACSLVPKNLMRSKRVVVNLSNIVCKNIPLLQELAFIEHEMEILQYIAQLKLQKEQERMNARESGLMKVCSCCFEDEVMPDDSFCCENGCICCKQCIVKSSEVTFGEGKLDFPCLGGCNLNFDLSTLQRFLPPNLFSKIAQRKAVQEVKAAGIQDLESCPFCDFATIPSGPPETDKIFACQNPECLKESCRLCKESSHVPLRCDEVEKDEDVKKRVFIENKMTEALLRKCWKCGISFYKEEGCNKMTCSCGALMCYVCGKPVTDYTHFNGIGGDKFDLCPLYSDTLKMNQQNVLKGAQKAKEEIGVKNQADLKIDPTSDIQQFYRDRAKRLPREPYLEQLDAGGAINLPMGNEREDMLRNLADGLRTMQQNIQRIQIQAGRNRVHVQVAKADRQSVNNRRQPPN